MAPVSEPKVYNSVDGSSMGPKVWVQPHYLDAIAKMAPTSKNDTSLILCEVHYLIKVMV